MLPTVFGSYDNSEAAEALLGALLEAGAAPEDLSVVIRTNGAIHRILEEGIEGLVLVDSGQGVARRFGHAAVQVEGSEIFESQIGGGISTSTPDDDVSSVAEMDDSQEAAEQMMYPSVGHSYSSEEEIEALRAANKGFFDTTRTGPSGLGLANSGEDDRSKVPIELSSVKLPGFALVLGDGMLATVMIGAGVAATVAGSPAAHLQDYLEDQEVPGDLAFLLSKDFEGGGAVIAIAAPPGGLDLETIQDLLEQNGAHNVQTVEAAD